MTVLGSKPPGDSLPVVAIIFDLDSCLAAANEVGDQLFEPAFEAIRAANHGVVPEEKLKAAFKDCWRFPFDSVAQKYGFSEEMTKAGWERLRTTEVTIPMHGYGDLDCLKELGGKLFLVTSGFRRLQESKIRALNIERLFAGICVDAIDEPGPKGKERIFQELLDRHGFRSEEVLVVGDNPESEIAAGVRLRMRTVQILRPGVDRGTNADYSIHTLGELVDLLRAPNLG